MKCIFFLCFLLVAGWFLPASAIAQLADNIGIPVPANAPATETPADNDIKWLEERVNISQDDIRDLRNHVDGLRQDWVGSNEKILKRLDEIVGEIESLKTQVQQLQEVKKSTANTQPAPPEQVPTSDTNKALALSDKEQYQQAYKHLVDKKLLLAREAMQQFIADYPQSSLADNAAYWIGETYFAEKDYIKASQQFSAAFEAYPESNKAPDNLLKLGLSLLRLDKKDESCLTLSALLERYPNAPTYIKDRAKGIIANVSCPPS